MIIEIFPVMEPAFREIAEKLRKGHDTYLSMLFANNTHQILVLLKFNVDLRIGILGQL